MKAKTKTAAAAQIEKTIRQEALREIRKSGRKVTRKQVNFYAEMVAGLIGMERALAATHNTRLRRFLAAESIPLAIHATEVAWAIGGEAAFSRVNLILRRLMRYTRQSGAKTGRK